MDVSVALLFTFLSVLAIGAAVVLKIQEQKSALMEDDDFISKAIKKKKSKLSANVGGITFRMYVALITILPILVGVPIYLFLQNMVIALLAAIVMVFVPDIILSLTTKKQQQQYDERYATGLRTLVSGLRSGMTINQAVDDVAKNPFVNSNIREGFAQISSDIRVGLSIQQAFQRFAENSQNKDAYDVAAAIAMQTEVGGSEAKVIESIADSIQQRIMLRKEIKSIFAETEVTAKITDAAPFIGLLLVCIFLSDYTDFYFSSIGGFLILVGILAFSVVGAFYIHHKLNKAKMGG